MKYKNLFTVIPAYMLAMILLVNVLSGSFGANLILQTGLPYVSSMKATFSNRLLIALAMPSFSGRWGSYNNLMENDWNEYFYYKKGITIAQAQGHGDEFAKVLAPLLQDETFENIDGYSVLETDLHPQSAGSAYTLWENVYIRNQSEQTPDVDSLMREKPSLNFESTEGPLVLIYHTHTSESYNTTGEHYTAESPTHSTDNGLNTVAVGKVFQDALSALGIESVQCTDRLDTSYNDAYDVSCATVQEYLEKYPSIRIVLDMHRDSIVDSDNIKYRPVTDIQGIQVAQMMMVVGMSTYTENDFVDENFRFAVNLANTLEQNFPGITRSVMLKNSTFNQEFSANSILVEMGTTGNTLTEAKRSAVFLASAVAQLLYENGYQGE